MAKREELKRKIEEEKQKKKEERDKVLWLNIYNVKLLMLYFINQLSILFKYVMYLKML